MAKKQAHLSDLLKTGKEVRFETTDEDGEEVEIAIWLRKPVSAQHEEAVAKARGSQARRRSTFRDKESDEYVSLMDDMEQFETKEDIITQLMRFEEHDLRSQAYNEILYDEDIAPRDEDGELFWGEAGEQYVELLSAMTARMAEITEYNDKLGAEDDDMLIAFDQDEELMRLEKQRSQLDEQVNERYEKLAAVKKEEFKARRFDDLKKELIKRLVDLDASIAWHDVYNKWMLFFSCRMPDDHQKRYFRDVDEIDMLPPLVRQTLQDEVDDLSQGLDDTKNSLSLQRS